MKITKQEATANPSADKISQTVNEAIEMLKAIGDRHWILLTVTAESDAEKTVVATTGLMDRETAPAFQQSLYAASGMMV